MAIAKKQRTRNPELIKGINRFGRHKSSKKNYIHFKKGANNKSKAPEKKEEKKTVSKWYTADDVKVPAPSRKSHQKPTRLRPSITPGTVVIVLAGRFRGKRVVFLKQLTSGLLLVTGPYKINGVPLRRVNQRYVIATRTKVDVTGVDVSAIDDAFFAKKKEKTASKKKKDGEEFFNDPSANKTEVSAERKAEQKKIDAALITNIGKVSLLKHYLNAKFSLTSGQRPHLLKF